MTFDNFSFGLTSDAGAALGGMFEQTRQSVLGVASGDSKMDFYQRLGSELMGALQGGEGNGAMQPASQALMQSPNLTSGFDNNWLTTQINAGSANGAKI